VLTSPDGVITVVGGKLTTYRRMAQDAVDAAVAAGRRPRAGPGGCRWSERRMRRRWPGSGRRPGWWPGTDRGARGARPGRPGPAAAEPVTTRTPVTGAELAFAVRHEGALDAGDLLDRRTRIGLVLPTGTRRSPAARALAQG